MIEFLSYVYIVGMILLMLFINLTNAFMGGSDKEIVLIFNSIIFWPIVAIYLILKLFITAIIFSIQEIYRALKT